MSADMAAVDRLNMALKKSCFFMGDPRIDHVLAKQAEVVTGLILCFSDSVCPGHPDGGAFGSFCNASFDAAV
jgi:hypothetical protein